ncbi:MAG: hypothetical protein JRG91_02135 [Deltaproteobacteria bacterium]|nr:hypothetical protein [Deltaproteobacteria bacterium]
MTARTALPAVLALLVGCGQGGHTEGDALDDQDVSGQEDVLDDLIEDAAEEDPGEDEDDPEPEPLVWPNEDCAASSHPCLMEIHDRITLMRPRVLALNFINHRSMAEMHDQLTEVIAAFTEGSRPHGYSDPGAEPAMIYELAYEIDLRDETPPTDWPYNNSTLFPREDPVEGYWGFDYEQLFTPEFADLYGIQDPSDPSRNLDLCELANLGLVHEVWLYGDQDVPDGSAAELLEIKPYYDEDRVRIDFPMNRCAGNGCFDDEDLIPEHCTSSIRISWNNNTRGPGCFMENFSHAFESIGARDPRQIPTLSKDFMRFAAFDLDERYGLAFDSWYVCPYGEPCLSYESVTSVSYDISGLTGTIDPYDPVCGNVHFIPNGRQHYDLDSPYPVLSTCEGFGLREGTDGGDMLRPFTSGSFAAYRDMAHDCMGAYLVFWMQSWPGPGSTAVGLDGEVMLSWWPYVYY